MDKSYISLTLSSVDPSGVQQVSTRKSLRRSWNQLPRCQRNLILLGIATVVATLFFLLPGDQSLSHNGRNWSTVGGGMFALPRWVHQKRATDTVAETEDVGGSEDVHVHSEASDAIESPGIRSVIDNISNLVAHSNRESENSVQRVIPPPMAAETLQNDDESLLRGPNIENSIKIPQTHNSLEDVNVINGNNKREANVPKINIEELSINNNNIEAPAADELQDTNNNNANVELSLESALKDPTKIPNSRGLSIDEFLNSLEAIDAQKQHFHGATNERQEAVVAAFKHSWNGYRKYAWGHDNLKPISQSSQDWFGLGLTIVDSLDTMYIMGLEDEFLEARDWVSEFLNFEINRDVNLFEVTIRVLGGLLSSYHLSGDKMFLKKSIELGNRLLPCFLSPSGIPYSDVNLASMSAHSPKWSPDSSTSEVTTIQLEFRDLSRSSNAPIYERVVEAVNEKVHALEKKNGLVPIFINANTGTFRSYSTISLGARGDSYYEYLLKQWLQTGRKENDILIQDYISAIDGVLTQLMRRTPKEHHVYIGELINGKDFKPKMDHLTCYLPGTLLLGHKYGMPDSHLLLAKDLLETCYQTYMQQPTHLAPEISFFALNDNEELEIYVKPNDAHNLLRPEFVESLYYFYALTGNRTYQDMGWNIFEAFEKHTKVAGGYTSIGNVKNIFNTRLRDMMESFWLGETLKYFYLLFSDNRKEIDLDKWIFNTEAHPLPARNN